MRISDWSSGVCSSELAPILWHRRAHQDAVLEQPRQPVGEDVARDPQFGLEFLEMMQFVEGGAQDEELPALTHRLECRRQAAFGQIPKRLAQFITHRRAAYPTLRGLGMGYKFSLATRMCSN